MKLLVKDIQIKTLVSGDKSARIILETLYARDIEQLAKLADVLEVEVDFKIGKK